MCFSSASTTWLIEEMNATQPWMAVQLVLMNNLYVKEAAPPQTQTQFQIFLAHFPDDFITPHGNMYPRIK